MVLQKMAHFHAHARTQNKKAFISMNVPLIKKEKGVNKNFSQQCPIGKLEIITLKAILPLKPRRSTTSVSTLIIPAVTFMKRNYR